MQVSTIQPRFAHQLIRQNGLTIMEDLQLQGITNEDAAVFYRGALVSLNGTLGAGNKPKVKLGCGDADMPMFALDGSADFGVAVNEYTLVTGTVRLVPATASVELITTEFEGNVEGTAYAPNQFLTASTGTPGYVAKSPALYNDRVICGQVTRGAYADHNGIRVLAFLPMNQPALSATLGS